MADVLVQPAPEFTTKLAPEERAEIEALDRLIERGRHKEPPASRAKTKELCAIGWIAMCSSVPVLLLYACLPRDILKFTLSYILIVLMVISGFGLYRLLTMRHTRAPVGFKSV